MCTSAVITGAICFLAGFGLGRFLTWTKKEPKSSTHKNEDDFCGILIITEYHG